MNVDLRSPPAVPGAASGAHVDLEKAPLGRLSQHSLSSPIGG